MGKPLTTPVVTAKFQLCMDVTSPDEPNSKTCCDAVASNADGQWCCQTGSLAMCFNEGTQSFTRTMNYSPSYSSIGEWFLGAPSANNAAYYAHTVSYTMENHDRYNYGKIEITATPF